MKYVIVKWDYKGLFSPDLEKPLRQEDAEGIPVHFLKWTEARGLGCGYSP